MSGNRADLHDEADSAVDDSDEDGFVSIIPCGIAPESSKKSRQHNGPGYYIDENTGEIIHYDTPDKATDQRNAVAQRRQPERSPAFVPRARMPVVRQSPSNSSAPPSMNGLSARLLLPPEHHPVKFTAEQGEQLIRWNGERFTCSTCRASSARLAEMDRHLLVHNGTPSAHRCELCDERLPTLTVLRNHVHAHTCVGWLLRCTRCECRFRDQTELRAHQCDGRTLHWCRQCGMRFASEVLRQAHQQFVHCNRSAYRCDDCRTGFVHRAALVTHRRIECTHLPSGNGAKC